MSDLEITLALSNCSDYELRRVVEVLRQTEQPAAEWRILVQIARQIEAQIPKPRIPEPGTWAVVEASHVDDPAGSWKFVHHASGPWFSSTRTFVEWDSLIDPVLVREGVE